MKRKPVLKAIEAAKEKLLVLVGIFHKVEWDAEIEALEQVTEILESVEQEVLKNWEGK